MPCACWGSQSMSGRSQRRSSRLTLQVRRPKHPGVLARVPEPLRHLHEVRTRRKLQCSKGMSPIVQPKAAHRHLCQASRARRSARRSCRAVDGFRYAAPSCRTFWWHRVQKHYLGKQLALQTPTRRCHSGRRSAYGWVVPHSRALGAGGQVDTKCRAGGSSLSSPSPTIWRRRDWWCGAADWDPRVYAAVT